MITKATILDFNHSTSLQDKAKECIIVYKKIINQPKKQLTALMTKAIILGFNHSTSLQDKAGECIFVYKQKQMYKK